MGMLIAFPANARAALLGMSSNADFHEHSRSDSEGYIGQPWNTNICFVTAGRCLACDHTTEMHNKVGMNKPAVVCSGHLLMSTFNLHDKLGQARSNKHFTSLSETALLCKGQQLVEVLGAAWQRDHALRYRKLHEDLCDLRLRSAPKFRS